MLDSGLVETTQQWDTVAVHPIPAGTYGELQGPEGMFYTPIVAILEQKCFLTIRTYQDQAGRYRHEEKRHEEQQEVRFTPGYLDNSGELLPIVDHEAFGGLEHERNIPQEQGAVGFVYF